MPKAMEGMDIPSFKKDTTVVDMKKGMDRYLYSTIVQSSVVQASYWEQNGTFGGDGVSTRSFILDVFKQIGNWTTTTTSHARRFVTTIVERVTRTDHQNVTIMEQRLKEKTEQVVMIQQQLQKKNELVVRIERELREKETVLVTLREEVASTRAQLSACSGNVDKVAAQLAACRRKGRWMEGKIRELQDPEEEEGGHADALDYEWELQK
ncbi:hypothetical protein E2562_003334 [Oryza meyeriana var. granulata]|uniref:Uncharacterized protein n=1 Tax=Oryza meyeriana var. granulata TaxID=110450 RepID=A0A6G1EFC7_9ORYZ|nr:hypothetical protein E2562_003334 [Oryza meyeriana var. granulata]